MSHRALELASATESPIDSPTSCGCCKSQDFGWFEECSATSSDDSSDGWNSFSPPMAMVSSSAFVKRRDSGIKDDRKELFVFDNILSSISCRAFGSEMRLTDQDSCASLTQIWIAVQSFRVVQAAEGLLAEFKVVLLVDDVVSSSWRRYSEFAQLAEEHGVNTGPTRRLLQARSPLDTSIEIWNDLESRKPWFRSTSVRYLMWKCGMLEDFLKSLLFESHSPQRLIVFVAGSL